MSDFWPVAFFDKILVAINRFTKPIAVFLALIIWADGFLQNAVISFFDTFTAVFTSASYDGISAPGSVSFGAIEYIGYINAFMPISEFVGLLGVYLTAWTGVIMMRWIKSLIPTISN